MTSKAQQHLTKAKLYIAKGEEFYRRAAEEISAAKQADFQLSNREIGGWFGRSESWVRQIETWSTNSQGTALPFSEPQGAVAQRHARSVLREAPPEQVDELIASLPPEAVAKVAKSVSREYERRGSEAKQKSEKAFREEVGDAFADDLEQEQRLRDAETKVFEARRALRDMLALLNDADLDAMRDSWREDFLKTLDDLSMRVDLARSLLSGTLSDDLEQFLSEV